FFIGALLSGSQSKRTRKLYRLLQNRVPVLPPGSTGRESGARVEAAAETLGQQARHGSRPEGPREPARRANCFRPPLPRPVRPRRHGPHGTRGIGLRPHPRAPLSRPVGPEGPAVRSSLSSQRKLIWMSLLVSSCCKGKSRCGTPKHRPFEAIESELYATDGSTVVPTSTASSEMSRASRPARSAARSTSLPFCSCCKKRSGKWPRAWDVRSPPPTPRRLQLLSTSFTSF